MREPFSSLQSSDHFEELCYDVLEAEGFRDLKWRGPAADGGRDIEARWFAPDPVGGTFQTHWFIECKWYTESVPFQQIEPKLLAASSNGVDYLLLITSSSVRNTALLEIERWLSTRGNPFQFRYWTGRDLLHRLVSHQPVFRKHFVNLSLPEWASRSAELDRLRLLATAGNARLTRRILPSLQWCQQMLALAPTDLIPIIDELELVSSELSLTRFQEAEVGSKPALRTLDLTNSVTKALACVERKLGERGGLRNLQAQIQCRTNFSTLFPAVYELCSNAAAYTLGAEFDVSLEATAHVWTLTISNDSSEHLPVVWPTVGFRGEQGRRKNPAGQGLGCWLANEALQSLGHTVSWSQVGPQWKVTVTGGVESEKN